MGGLDLDATMKRGVKHAFGRVIEGPGETRRFARRAFRVVSSANIPRMAAALSFRTIFGLVPVLVIGVAVLGGFASDTQVEEAVRDLMTFSGLSRIVVEPEAGAGDTALDPWGDMGEGRSDLALEPESGSAARLDAWLQELVENVRKVSFVAIGMTGLITLAYAALSFMVEIEKAANQICHAPTGRSWVRRVTQYWTTLTLGTLCLIGTFIVGRKLTVTIEDLGALAGEAGASLVAQGAGFAVSVLISFVLLVFLYLTMPNTRVSVRSAAVGAAFAAVTWELGKWGFTRVVMVSTQYRSLYGAIALVPLFLLWVYVTWVIVLFGLQIAYVLQHWRALPDARDGGDGPSLIDSTSLVRVAGAVAERFAAGKVALVDDVAEAAGLRDDTARLLLDRLVGAGMVHRVTEESDDEGYALARPASEISARALLELARSLTARAEGGGGEGALDRLARAQVEAAGTLSLAELIPPHGRRTPGPSLATGDAAQDGTTASA